MADVTLHLWGKCGTLGDVHGVMGHMRLCGEKCGGCVLS